MNHSSTMAKKVVITTGIVQARFNDIAKQVPRAVYLCDNFPGPSLRPRRRFPANTAVAYQGAPGNMLQDSMVYGADTVGHPQELRGAWNRKNLT